MNAIPMLTRCAKGQAQQDFDAGLPATYLAPPIMWREQETLTDHRPLGCEDYEG